MILLLWGIRHPRKEGKAELDLGGCIAIELKKVEERQET